MTTRTVAAATARVPATCGELLQGVDRDGPVLVSLPIDFDGTVQVQLTNDGDVRVHPYRPRAADALRIALAHARWDGGAMVTLGCEVPPLRGMGSSTVDVAGVIGAALAACGISPRPAQLAALVAAVEPSDSSALPDLWAVDHVTGSRAVHLGALPAPLYVVAVDGGGTVDTLDVHANHGAGPPLPDDALPRLATAIRCADLATLGRLASDSAARNQRRLPNPAYPSAVDASRAARALGVCAAHSGTLVGVLCATPQQAAAAARALREEGRNPLTWRTAARGMRIRLHRTEA